MYNMRKPNRLKYHNYAAKGYYAVTFCTKELVCSLGEVVDSAYVGGGFPAPHPVMILSEAGRIVREQILQIGIRFPSAKVCSFVVMPNHVHMIIALLGPGDPATTKGAGDPPPTLGAVVAWVKYLSAREINARIAEPFKKLWQDSFYDHIVRDRADYQRETDAIIKNVARWKEDFYNPQHPDFMQWKRLPSQ